MNLQAKPKGKKMDLTYKATPKLMAVAKPANDVLEKKKITVANGTNFGGGNFLAMLADVFIDDEAYQRWRRKCLDKMRADLKKTEITFGKYKGLMFGDIMTEDSNYLDWVVSEFAPCSNTGVALLTDYLTLFGYELPKKDNDRPTYENTYGAHRRGRKYSKRTRAERDSKSPQSPLPSAYE